MRGRQASTATSPANERTDTPTPDEVRAEGLHGDFAGGERKDPLTSEDDTPGTFADTNA